MTETCKDNNKAWAKSNDKFSEILNDEGILAS